jgi:glycosyltransferase involved in cell wall biosynthesis
MQTKSSSDSIWRFIPSFYFIYERLALFMSSQVYVYSETDFNRILKIKKSACQLRGWYNDHVFKQVGLARDDKSFMWVGRFEQPKDPLLAIRSFAKALEIDSSLNLCMIGEGSLKWAMTDEIARLGLSERITISSPLNQRELALRMNHCGTLLHTSEFEGSPRILLEALACGMRVVSNSLADPDKLSERFGSCSKSRLEGDVASALLLDLPKTRQEIELKEFLSHVAGSNIVGRDF